MVEDVVIVLYVTDFMDSRLDRPGLRAAHGMHLAPTAQGQ